MNQKTESPIEEMFLKDCRTVGLVVETQHQIGKYRADFYLRDRHIVVECDGKEFHGDEKKEYDGDRDFFMERWGYKVVRIPGKFIFADGEAIAFYLKHCKYEAVKDWMRFVAVRRQNTHESLEETFDREYKPMLEQTYA